MAQVETPRGAAGVAAAPPQGSTDSCAPRITPNRRRLSNQFPSLAFTVTTGELPYFEVLLTTDPSLFDPANAGKRNASNFYASRQDAGLIPCQGAYSLYVAPTAVLRGFAQATPRPQAIYYTVAAYRDQAGADPVFAMPAPMLPRLAPSVAVAPDYQGQTLATVLSVRSDRLRRYHSPAYHGLSASDDAGEGEDGYAVAAGAALATVPAIPVTGPQDGYEIYHAVVQPQSARPMSAGLDAAAPARALSFDVIGIDVSVYDGDIDWGKVEAWRNPDGNPVAFAFARATYGGTGTDGKFDDNWTAMANVSILCGPYHFLTPGADVPTQISHFFDTVTASGGLHDYDLPPMIDFEWDPKKLTASQKAGAADFLKDALDRTQDLFKRTPIIYTGKWSWQPLIGNDPRFAGYPIWIAQYDDSHDDKNPASLDSKKAHYDAFTRTSPSTPLLGRSPFTDWQFWQIRVVPPNEVDGINHNLDFDVFNGDAAALRALTNVAAAAPAPVAPPQPGAPAAAPPDAGAPSTGPSDGGALPGGTQSVAFYDDMFGALPQPSLGYSESLGRTYPLDAPEPAPLPDSGDGMDDDAYEDYDDIGEPVALSDSYGDEADEWRENLPPFRALDDEGAEPRPLTVDDMLKIVDRVAGAESGADRYAAINADTEFHNPSHDAYGKYHIGLSYGIIQFTQDSGTLGQLLAMMRDRDPDTFRATFGPSADDLVRVCSLPGPPSKDAQGGRSARVQPVDGADLWEEPWVTRFRQAGAVTAFQAAQNQLAATLYIEPMRRFAAWLGLCTDRAFTMIIDRAVQMGVGGARRWVIGAVGPIQSPAQRTQALSALGYTDLRAFQSATDGLAADGQWGPETHAAMVSALRALGSSPIPIPTRDQMLDAMVRAATGTSFERRVTDLRNATDFTDTPFAL